MGSGSDLTTAEMIRLRENGDKVGSIDLLNRLLNKVGASDLPSEVLAEGLAICLLAGQTEPAYRFYLMLKERSKSEQFWKAEVLARLHLATGRMIPELYSCMASSTWVDEFLADGNDPIYPVDIQDVSIRFAAEAAVFDFLATCRSCGGKHHFVVVRTLLVDREFLCPICLSRQRVDYEAIKPVLLSKASVHHTGQLLEWDKSLHQLRLALDADAFSGQRFPLLARYLSHDYVVSLSGICAAELAASGEGGAE